MQFKNSRINFFIYTLIINELQDILKKKNIQIDEINSKINLENNLINKSDLINQKSILID